MPWAWGPFITTRPCLIGKDEGEADCTGQIKAVSCSSPGQGGREETLFRKFWNRDLHLCPPLFH